MSKQDAVERLAREVCDREGLDLVEIAAAAAGHRSLIKVTIDRAGGVGVEDCRRVSLALGTLLEAEGVIPGPAVLEVTSPGITRQLKSAADYRRRLGSVVEVTVERDGARSVIQGTVAEVGDAEVTLEGPEGRVVIPLEAVRLGRPVIDWQALMRKKREPRGAEDTSDE